MKHFWTTCLVFVIIISFIIHFVFAFLFVVYTDGSSFIRFTNMNLLGSDNKKSDIMIIWSNMSYDIEFFNTSNWNCPKDCIDGKLLWERTRNTPASIVQYNDVMVWRSFLSLSTYFKGKDIFSNSHRCQGMENESPWAFSSIINSLYSGNYIDEGFLDSSQIWGEQYYHMIQEKAFLFGTIRPLLKDNPNLKIIVDSLPIKLSQFANLLGINSKTFYIQDYTTLTTNVKKLHVPLFLDCATQSSEYSLSTRQWIRDEHSNLYPTTSSSSKTFNNTASFIIKKPSDIIIINRIENGICNRCFLNSDGLYIQLQKIWGHKRKIHHLILGDYDMYDIMKLFSQTEFLIGPHGAGLVNMIFLPDNAKIIEIFNHPKECNFCFYELSQTLGLKHKIISPVDITHVNIPKIIQILDGLM